MVRVAVVGAGPAGIMAAMEAARLGAEVLLFDTNDHVGRKLSVTGSGRCNLSNEQVRSEAYVCDDPGALRRLFALQGGAATRQYLHDLGVLTYATPDGWYYPLSESAASVARIFAEALDQVGVVTCLKCRVANLYRGEGNWILELGGPSHTLSVDRVVVATGGKAYPTLGSTGSIFPVLKALGHRVVLIRPALAPIQADVRHLRALQGIRRDVGLTLLAGDRPLGHTVGNMIFTEYGLNGPAAMDLSHLVDPEAEQALEVSIDLLPYHREDLAELLVDWRFAQRPLAVLLQTFFVPKVALAVLCMARFDEKVFAGQLSSPQRRQLLQTLTHLRARVTGTRGFRYAQLSTGGIPLDEVKPDGLASRIAPDLFFAGEVLNVYGPCGGYNLHFAFASGLVGGRAVATAEL